MTKIKEIDGGALHGRRFLVLVFFWVDFASIIRVAYAAKTKFPKLCFIKVLEGVTMLFRELKIKPSKVFWFSI